MVIYTFQKPKIKKRNRMVKSVRGSITSDEKINQKIHRHVRYNLYISGVILCLLIIFILYCFFRGVPAKVRF